jgi:hypothetical protein
MGEHQMADMSGHRLGGADHIGDDLSDSGEINMTHPGFNLGRVKGR